MKKHIFYTVFLFLFTITIGFAQDNEVIRCYTAEAEAEMRAANPALGTIEEFENWLEPLVREYKDNAQFRAVQTLPIVFHIIHDNDAVGSGDNLNASYINAQLEQLNNDFRRIVGTSGHNTNPVGADTEIEFCAATVDPQGNTLAEPGINRINRNSVGWTAPPYGVCLSNGGIDRSYIDNTIKAQSQWDPNNYVNVWVMDLNCGLLGYAQFPSQSGLSGLNNNGGAANTDGVVVLTTSMGSTGTPNPNGGVYNKGRTLTHEIGHYLGLRHIWGDGGCSVDDYCADTPASDAANSGCPNHTSCGTQDMVENYMDYTHDDCMNIFTADQKARIQAVMANSPRRGSIANSSACSGGGGGSTCGTTISSFPYTETFESSFGAWTQDTGDDFDWTRRSGGTPSSNTGPSSAAQGTYYAYMESSSPNNSNDVAILTSPCFDLGGAATASLTFQYHMYGASNMGNLKLEIKPDGGSWTTIWSETGNQGNSWQAANVNLASYAAAPFQLRFNGTTGTTWQGDMAIDDLEISTTTGGGSGCNGGVSSFPYTETFESSFGAWTQDTGDDFDWTRRSGGTPSSNTGPSSAAQGTYYAYMESSSPNNSNDVAILTSPCFDLSGESSANFSFQYHMYGASNMGNLKLEAKTGSGSWTTVWSETGNQGNSWQSANVDLGAYAGGDMQLRFNGTTGSTWQGDMAIDDLELTTTGGGSGGCTDVNISITFDNYPEETSWSIEDASGNTVASGGTYGSQADGSTLNLTECLDAGCYDFIINDAYGDGICCSYGNGSYTVTVNGSTVASGSNFGSSESTNFCVGSGNRVETTPIDLVALSCFPNPATEQITVAYESSQAGEVQVSIVNLIGEVIKVQSWEVYQGDNEMTLPLNRVENGTYFIVVAGNGTQVNQRVIVLK